MLVQQLPESGDWLPDKGVIAHVDTHMQSLPHTHTDWDENSELSQGSEPTVNQRTHIHTRTPPSPLLLGPILSP